MDSTSALLRGEPLGKAPAVSFAAAPMPCKKKKVSIGSEFFPRTMMLKDGFSLASRDGTVIHHVKMRNRLFSTSPVLFTMHAGTSDSDPVMAVAKYAPDTKKCMLVQVPRDHDRQHHRDQHHHHHDHDHDDSETDPGWRFTQYSKTEALGGITKSEHCFSGEIHGREETFVWQFSKEVDKTIGKVGWELVRVTRGRNELMAVLGFTKDGFARKRVFAFMEDGRKFGPQFEIAAVMTMIRVDWLYQQA